ncbi:hypothetical protein [[Pseudomonas] boreopolis]|uniref:hypothetical protein n=1 Tax=Xanthomonas boreopolis TaxID=86183 RepID=UPI003D3E4DD3
MLLLLLLLVISFWIGQRLLARRRANRHGPRMSLRRGPSAAAEPAGKTPQGRRTWARRKKAKHRFAPAGGHSARGEYPRLGRMAGESRRKIPLAAGAQAGGA